MSVEWLRLNSGASSSSILLQAEKEQSKLEIAMKGVHSNEPAFLFVHAFFVLFNARRVR